MLKDEELLLQLRGTPEEFEDAFSKIYHDPDLRSMAFSRMRHATQEEANDIWQESVAAFLIAVRREKFEGTGRISTYIVSTVINKWLTLIKQKKQNPIEPIEYLLADAEVTPPEPDFAERIEGYRKILANAIGQLGERCQEMLKAWSEQSTLASLTEKHQFSSKRMASKELYRCWVRLKEILHDHPAQLEQLREWLLEM